MGYQALIEQCHLSVIPHYRRSYISTKGRGYVQLGIDQEIYIYPKDYAIQDPKDIFQQLEFALKYDGINLEILQKVFEKLDPKEFEITITKHPTSKYLRILWFLYEFLTEKKLIVPEIKKLGYVKVLDPNLYFTSEGVKSVRHRVINNLLGNKDFCPMLRKTATLMQHIDQHYDLKAKNLAEKYDPALIARAGYYLYTKETLSSYEIEREKPSQDRINRFIHVLRQAPHINEITKKYLIELQNIIVDPRFSNIGYRVNQNYIGESMNEYVQRVHYISPKPENVELLMSGLLRTMNHLMETNFHSVLIAAVIAFGFVYIHPFEDGNGRIHRFLIHYILSKQKFTPEGIIFPISAVMLQNMREYDNILEYFSRPLMNELKYHLDEEGELTVKSESLSYYKYIDYTKACEYLFDCVDKTIQNHFEKEVQFLINYDKTKHEIQNIIDMPDKLINLFIRFVMQNHGTLSQQKRTKYFSQLTEEEIRRLENIVTKHL